jgi:hypothetical protein
LNSGNSAQQRVSPAINAQSAASADGSRLPSLEEKVASSVAAVAEVLVAPRVVGYAVSCPKTNETIYIQNVKDLEEWIGNRKWGTTDQGIKVNKSFLLELSARIKFDEDEVTKTGIPMDKLMAMSNKVEYIRAMYNDGYVR